MVLPTARIVFRAHKHSRTHKLNSYFELLWSKTSIFPVNFQTVAERFFHIWYIPLWSACSPSNTFSSAWELRHFLNFFCVHKMVFKVLSLLRVCVSENVCVWSGTHTLADLHRTFVRVCELQSFYAECVCVCLCVCARTETQSGSLPGLRAWLRERLKPVYSGCVVEKSGGGTRTS